MTVSVAIVIPTRDRSDLAIAAIRSLLQIDDARLVHIIVSNNSSDAAHVRSLESFCERTADPHLVHIRPPAPLAMADHWDWAIGESLKRSDATHLALHYDRRISRPELGLLFDSAADRPDVPITYLIDVIFPLQSRFRIHQMPWTGGLCEIGTKRALRLASLGLLTDLWQAFPVLVNCVTPRTVLEQVRDRFGSYCASTSPESCFGFRFCAVASSYLHFDRPLAIHYGAALSNGMGYLRGDSSGTFDDFTRLFGDRPWLDAAPLPGLSLGQNSFYHEFCLARRQSGSAEFPPIDMVGYLNDLARGLYWIADPVRRGEIRDLLVSHGWRGDEDRPAAPPDSSAAGTLSERLARLRADHWRIRPEDLLATGLKSESRALRHARQYMRPPTADGSFLAPLGPVPA